MRIRPAVLAVLCSFATPVHAQDAAEAVEAEPPPEYAGFVQEALQESAQGNWTDARAAFRQAHEVFPNARTERGMGMVSFELRDYVDAVRHLRRALANPTRVLTEQQAIEVQALLERSLGRVASFGLGGLPEGAELTVDGRQVQAEEDGALLLPIGEHQVTVQGEHRWQSTIPVRGGEAEPLPMTFPLPEEAPVRAPEAALAPAPIVAPSPPPIGAVVLVIGGVAALLAGVGVLAAGLADYYAVNGASSSTEWADISGAYGRTQTLQGVGYGVMGLGAALTVGGALWLSMGDADAGAGAQLRVRGVF